MDRGSCPLQIFWGALRFLAAGDMTTAAAAAETGAGRPVPMISFRPALHANWGQPGATGGNLGQPGATGGNLGQRGAT